MHLDRQLHVGLLLDRSVVDKYIRDLIIWIDAQPDIVLSQLAIKPAASCNKWQMGDSLSDLLAPPVRMSRLLFGTISLIELLLLRAYKAYWDHYRVYDVHDLRRSDPAQGGGNDTLGPSSAPQLDVLIDCRGEIFSGLSSKCARLGVIALRYGDHVIARQGPPGFWECYRRQSATNFVIQRLTDGGGVDVLRSGSFTTQFFYSLNQAHLCTKSYQHLKGLLKALVRRDSIDALLSRPIASSSSASTVPPSRYAICYFLKLASRLAKKVTLRLLKLRQSWGISILGEGWEKAAYWKSTAVPLPPGRYWADPFLHCSGNRIFCFVEEFVFADNRGHIAVIEMKEGSIKSTPVVVENFHLSFPFIFQYNANTYMCPESSEAREIRIYRCVDFPGKWVLDRIIMQDVCAADTMIFHKSGKWWMFTNIDHANIGDYCTELYLFYADSPIESNWTPHPRNPIKVDCRGGRNAGLIIEGDRICRVGQRQGFDQYGEGLSIYEIELLDEENFVETLIWEMEPDFRNSLLGIHHLSSIEGITVIDHVTMRLVFGAGEALQPSV